MSVSKSPTEASTAARTASVTGSETGLAGRVILEPAGIRRATTRIAHEILERNRGADSVALVAIVQGGVPVADMLAESLREIGDTTVLRGVLDVTLYRDDVIGHGKRPIPGKTWMPFSVAGERVVLVEDVVFTGRTVRSAMDAVIDFGRPEVIQVATLVDRGHRELPIRVDFVGKNIPTSRAEKVVLRQNQRGEYEVAVI
jgi:pyrimidine operon attenuation protein/uracil phosphoribosyltransferase